MFLNTKTIPTFDKLGDFMKSLVVVISAVFVMSALQAKPMAQDEALKKAKRSCYTYNTACPLGAEIASNLNLKEMSTQDKIAEASVECRQVMESDRRKISCLQGAQFFYSNLLGHQALTKKAMKTTPFFVYTAGHALGVSISLMNYMSDKENYKQASVEGCELYSFNSDVLERCHQGLSAFQGIL
jgi:hypothetical protein